MLEPHDRVIEYKFIPALLRTSAISETERNLYSLQIRMGGIGLHVLTDKAPDEFATSTRVTAPLAAIMVMQGNTLPDPEEVKQIRAESKQEKDALLKQKADIIEQMLPDSTKRAVAQAKEKGASTWLSVLPLEGQGFTLNKAEFRDALAIRYKQHLRDLPSHCPCGQKYTLDHALNCKRGGFIIMRHNSVRDFAFFDVRMKMSITSTSRI